MKFGEVNITWGKLRWMDSNQTYLLAGVHTSGNKFELKKIDAIKPTSAHKTFTIDHLD